MLRLTLLIGLFCLISCTKQNVTETSPAKRPSRIVSLDYCADQYVLKLADREQILALSPEALMDFSYMREAAERIPVVRPLAENVLILKPDLVVRSYGGGPNATTFFERADIPVLQVGWASTIDGEDMGSIPFIIEQMAKGLGQASRGHQLVTDYRARLAELKNKQQNGTALYMTPSGVTTGPGSLIHDMLEIAGLTNFQTKAGWHSVDLEKLIVEQPDLVATAFFNEKQTDNWTPLNSPVARKTLWTKPIVNLEGAWTSCGAWFVLDAIEALTESQIQ